MLQRQRRWSSGGLLSLIYEFLALPGLCATQLCLILLISWMIVPCSSGLYGVRSIKILILYLGAWGEGGKKLPGTSVLCSLIKSSSAIRVFLKLEPVGRFFLSESNLNDRFPVINCLPAGLYNPVHLIDSLIWVSYNLPLAPLARARRSLTHVRTVCQKQNLSKGISSRDLSISIRALGEDVARFDGRPTPPLRSYWNSCGDPEAQDASDFLLDEAQQKICSQTYLLVHQAADWHQRAPAVCAALISPVHWGWFRSIAGFHPGDLNSVHCI